MEFYDYVDGNIEEILIIDINYYYFIMFLDLGCKFDIYFNLYVVYKVYFFSYWFSILIWSGGF